MNDSANPERETRDLQSAFSRPLLTWYDKNRRPLPWRETKDPYAILVSEVMLQQTQVKTVLPYYKRWMSRYPTVQDLADAPESDVLKSWEGLGYYRRARLLRQAARFIVSQHSGNFPRSVEELARLPGVGRYTLGAVASIAFGLRLPVLDGNVARVLIRYFGVCRSSSRGDTQKTLWQLAEQLLRHAPGKWAGDFNQALMELGATVCAPRRPFCLLCPVRRGCWAFDHGVQDELPAPAPRPEVVRQFEYAVLAIHRGRVLLQQRADDSRMAKLWQFPSVTFGRPLRKWTESWAHLFGSLNKAEKLSELDYTVTHHRIHLRFFRGRGFRPRKTVGAQWVDLASIKDLPFTSAHRKLAEQFAQSH